MAALRAGVCNYAAAARFLDVAEDTDAVSTALRRFEADLPEFATEARDARVTMESGVGLGGEGAPLLSAGGTDVVPNAGSLTAVLAAGEVDAAALGAVLDALSLAEVSVAAAGAADGSLVVVVPRRAGADALRTVEAALDAVPAGGAPEV